MSIDFRKTYSTDNADEETSTIQFSNLDETQWYFIPIFKK